MGQIEQLEQIEQLDSQLAIICSPGTLAVSGDIFFFFFFFLVFTSWEGVCYWHLVMLLSILLCADQQKIIQSELCPD